MLKYDQVVEVDRLKNLVEVIGWKLLKEVYQDNHVVVSFSKEFPPPEIPLSVKA